mmetsp:Transcript_4505/g.8650  ORF Transcript_4505/g.8650 Transcript_4505/m.8650 type:complete len:250 (-) Transcript_4505:189-938(-)|eukprot:CAMPEP_0171658838 /NCGR_PEP_ID=MMETSP0990-20121206/43207_1 /TAXON_ID=483369 /ORGANISM="non described non described, Strain CCMP2098" /LENGTH=249 /DNA_ID=CAMNT_0012240163 /DNA_START=17 /DNA_END=766 /DNA_ORIENTATION=+
MALSLRKTAKFAVFSAQQESETNSCELSSLPTTAAGIVSSLGLVPHPEGGFFLETWRTGTLPMVTRGQTALDVSKRSLVDTDRADRRPDKDYRRNCISSIFWMPTAASPKLWLGVNQSDHIHYYHGGSAFEYFLVDPATSDRPEPPMRRVILGPNLAAGHLLQMPVQGGTWKAGRLLPSSGGSDYCLIGEAVGPAFEVHDFDFVTADDLAALRPDLVGALAPFIKGADDSFDAYYNDDEKRQERSSQRT